MPNINEINIWQRKLRRNHFALMSKDEMKYLALLGWTNLLKHWLCVCSVCRASSSVSLGHVWSRYLITSMSQNKQKKKHLREQKSSSKKKQTKKNLLIQYWQLQITVGREFIIRISVRNLLLLTWINTKWNIQERWQTGMCSTQAKPLTQGGNIYIYIKKHRSIEVYLRRKTLESCSKCARLSNAIEPVWIL